MKKISLSFESNMYEIISGDGIKKIYIFQPSNEGVRQKAINFKCNYFQPNFSYNFAIGKR